MEICVFCSTNRRKTKTYMRCTTCKTPCCYDCCLFNPFTGKPICLFCYDNTRIKPLVFNLEEQTIKNLEEENNGHS